MMRSSQIIHAKYCRDFLKGENPPVYFIVDSPLQEKHDDIMLEIYTKIFYNITLQFITCIFILCTFSV